MATKAKTTKTKVFAGVEQGVVDVLRKWLKSNASEIKKLDPKKRNEMVSLYGALMSLVTKTIYGDDKYKPLRDWPDARHATLVKKALKAEMNHFLKAFDTHKIDKRSWASFRGNLPETPGLVTPQEQKRTVDYLKDAGVLPETEDSSDYPILTAGVKREVIATLLKLKEGKLANEVARWPTQRVKGAKVRKFKVGDEVKYDSKWLRNTGQMTGDTPRVKGKVIKLSRMGGDMWPVVQFPKAYDPEPRLIHPNNLRLVGKPDTSA